MVPRLRHLLLVLIAFAFIGGTSFQLAHSAEFAGSSMMEGTPCDMVMSHAHMQHDKPMPPCKRVTSDCINSMGCVTDAALPARTVNLDRATQFSGVDYWSVWSTLDDFVPEPEPLPPRTI